MNLGSVMSEKIKLFKTFQLIVHCTKRTLYFKIYLIVLVYSLKYVRGAFFDLHV